MFVTDSIFNTLPLMRPIHSSRLLLLVIFTLLTGVSAYSSSSNGPKNPSNLEAQENQPTSVDSDNQEKIAWSACGGSSTLECGTLQVPVNYGQPSQDTLDIALIRIPAKESERQGALLLNPGGPGGSGIDLVRSFNKLASDGAERGIPLEVRQGYDIVGFDPRALDSAGRLTARNSSLLTKWFALIITTPEPQNI